jgi:hypothetical protein
MADIFHFAELVYVWLGGCSGSKLWNEEVEDCGKHYIEWDGTFRPTAKGNDPLCEVYAGKSQWWWRTWAVQEVALGQKIAVLIGPHQLSWHKAREALEQCWLKSPWTIDIDREKYREAYQQLDQIHTVRGKRGWVCNHLRYLLQLTSSHAASDPRDKIYGVLGLLEINNPGIELLPDYNKTYEEVCRDATLHLIQTEESLDILLEDWQRLQQRPFWAIDFAHSPRHPQSLLQRGEINYLDSPQNIGNELMCCSSRDSKASFRVEDQHLVVYGIKFDTIETVVRFDEENLGHFTIEPNTFMVNKDLHQFQPNGASQQSFDDASDPWAALRGLELLARQLHTGSFDMTGFNLEVIDVTEQFARTITGDRYAEAFRLQKATSQLYREYAWATLRGRTFFLTEKGFCGVAAPETQVADSVLVLFGASMPAVLRPYAMDEYRLVGECYISGIM